MNTFTDTFETEVTSHVWSLVREGILDLRAHVWSEVLGRTVPRETLEDPEDHFGTHWLIFCGGVLIASARASLHDDPADLPEAHAIDSELEGPASYLGRLVVARNYRGLGIGTSLDKSRVEWASINGARCVVGHAQRDRAQSLERLGFSPCGHSGAYVPEFCELSFAPMILDLSH